ncbi:MAG TPA: sulfotransferase [Fibrobacteria bacterium]|nr:sulfotransferase [Fibrobacteria bacterium]
MTPHAWKAKLSDPDQGFNILVTWGRSGSNLLDSFLDGHPELVRLPCMLLLLTEWDESFAPHALDKAELRRALLERSGFSRAGYFEGLGENRDAVVAFPKERIADLALELFDPGSPWPLREFAVCLHAAWGHIAEVPPDSVKGILMHQHVLPSDYALNACGKTIRWEFGESGAIWDRLFREFPGLKIVCTVRHPFETAASIWNTLAREHDPVDLSRWFLQLWSLLTGPALVATESRKRPGRWILARFEDIHGKTESVLKEVCGHLGISSDHPCLRESTVMGRLWWGNNPDRPCNGANPAMAAPAFPRLPENVRGWISHWLADACGELGYPAETPSPRPAEPLELESWCWALRSPRQDPSRLYALAESDKRRFLDAFWSLRERLCGTPPSTDPGPRVPNELPWRHRDDLPSARGRGKLAWRIESDAAGSTERAWRGIPREVNPYHWREQLARRLEPFDEVEIHGQDPEWTEIVALSCLSESRTVAMECAGVRTAIDPARSRDRDRRWRESLAATANPWKDAH